MEQHVGYLFFAKKEAACQGTFGYGCEVGKQPPVHAQYQIQQIGIPGILDSEEMDFLSADGHMQRRFGIIPLRHCQHSFPFEEEQ